MDVIQTLEPKVGKLRKFNMKVSEILLFTEIDANIICGQILKQ